VFFSGPAPHADRLEGAACCCDAGCCGDDGGDSEGEVGAEEVDARLSAGGGCDEGVAAFSLITEVLALSVVCECAVNVCRVDSGVCVCVGGVLGGARVCVWW
jgi:hypothetical protein